MRAASRVFYAIAIFAVTAALLYGAGSGFDDYQALTVLGAFALSCTYLGLLLGKQAAHDTAAFVFPAAEEGHEEEIHLPGPSWYPAAYGVSGAFVVLGLAFNYTVLLVGVVLLVLTTLGWARESVVDYRREIAHVAHPAHAHVSPEAVEVAHRILAFRAAHGGAEAVVAHLGRGRGEVVLVGSDGVWGNFGVRDVAMGRAAAALAGTGGHASWPAGLGARMRPDPSLWQRMAGTSPFTSPEHDLPRDGATQVASRVFLAIGIFGVGAAGLYFSGLRRMEAIQATTILSFFAVANFYLYVALRNAKALPDDAAYADENYVTREPTQPPAMDASTLHLPGPSWWPAIFAVAGAAIVLGLAFSYTVLVVGIVLLVGCAIGWGVESVHEYRAALAHRAHH